jgi:hypothetical protein
MCLKRNQDLREAKGDIPAYLIGEKLSCHENTVYRLFRSELTREKKAEILAAIDEIKQEMKENG